MAWLVPRYGLEETIAGCWHRHPGMVEELTALYAGWRAAYHGEDLTSTGWDPLGWHEALGHALPRLRAADRQGCLAGTHRPDLPAPAVLDLAAAKSAGPPTEGDGSAGYGQVSPPGGGTCVE
ncbi:MAG: hypothetical protein ACYDAQ_13290 [Mycobacteriales bacterium]